MPDLETGADPGKNGQSQIMAMHTFLGSGPLLDFPADAESSPGIPFPPPPTEQRRLAITRAALGWLKRAWHIFTTKYIDSTIARHKSKASLFVSMGLDPKEMHRCKLGLLEDNLAAFSATAVWKREGQFLQKQLMREEVQHDLKTARELLRHLEDAHDTFASQLDNENSFHEKGLVLAALQMGLARTTMMVGSHLFPILLSLLTLSGSCLPHPKGRGAPGGMACLPRSSALRTLRSRGPSEAVGLWTSAGPS